MNDNHLPSDDLLQLVFGELDANRQAAVRKAVAEDAELAATARGLEAAVTAVRAENIGQVSDNFNDRLRRRMSDVLDRTQTESARPTLLTRCPTNWRWIMRHPVSRATAAAIFVLAIVGVALWFDGAGTTPAFADFVQPILEAKNIKFKITTEIEGEPPVTGEGMVIPPARMRQEVEMPDKSKHVMICDWGQEKALTLDLAAKRAIVLDYAKMSKDKTPGNYFREFLLLLLDAQGDKPDFKREPLGEKEIEGRHVVGYRLTGRGLVYNFWGDPKTAQPVLIEQAMAMYPDAKTTMSDFVFNVEMDESLFSVEPPAGYEVMAPTVDLSQPTEKDLVETFRGYSQLIQSFPASLDMHSLIEALVKKFFVPKQLGQEPRFNRQEFLEAQGKLQRGIVFAQQLPPEADAHYAGKGVSPGAADTPIFWYRPKDGEKYRVIYADLSVREADTPPSVPDAQPVPAPSRVKK